MGTGRGRGRAGHVWKTPCVAGVKGRRPRGPGRRSAPEDAGDGNCPEESPENPFHGFAGLEAAVGMWEGEKLLALRVGGRAAMGTKPGDGGTGEGRRERGHVRFGRAAGANAHVETRAGIFSS